MREPPFEILEHTADVGLRARGANLSELFANGARGMFSILCDPSAVRNEQQVPIEVHEEERAYLFAQWLDELLYLFSARRLVFCDFTATVRRGFARGVAMGEKLDLNRHELRAEIKGVTYHELEVKRCGRLWVARVIFDV